MLPPGVTVTGTPNPEALEMLIDSFIEFLLSRGLVEGIERSGTGAALNETDGMDGVPL